MSGDLNFTHSSQYYFDGSIAEFKFVPHLWLGTDPVARYPASSPRHLLGLGFRAGGIQGCGRETDPHAMLRFVKTSMTRGCGRDEESKDGVMN